MEEIRRLSLWCERGLQGYLNASFLRGKALCRPRSYLAFELVQILNLNFIFPYLRIGGFSNRWPPLDVLKHKQPEALDLRNREGLLPVCNHLSDSLEQVLTLESAVLSCEGEE